MCRFAQHVSVDMPVSLSFFFFYCVTLDKKGKFVVFYFLALFPQFVVFSHILSNFLLIPAEGSFLPGGFWIHWFYISWELTGGFMMRSLGFNSNLSI